MTFDDVLPTLVRICETTAGFDALKRCCVVRDLTGRVRLVLDPAPGPVPFDVDALSTALKQELQDYFAPPIWSTAAASKEEARLAGEIFRRPEAKLWAPRYDDPITGVPNVAARCRWFKFERRLSKQEWLESNDMIAPWELGQGPGIVTFYSFKGGVGRTTMLMACAWQLARAGNRVVVIDLDLEAPGVGLALGAKTQRGVIDFLVDQLATGHADLDGCVGNAQALGADGDRVAVVPAGVLGPEYLEKLARLDFIGSTPKSPRQIAASSPIEQAMQVLLNKLRGYKFTDGSMAGSVKAGRPADYIFIDARAGLHDLAGLSLHRLAHVDVLAGRTNAQSYAGLELSVSMLVQRKSRPNVECILVQTMVPPDGTTEAIVQEEEFLDKSFEWFKKYVYDAQQSTTVIKADNKQPHWPSVIRFVEARGRFASLQSVDEQFHAKDYRMLLERIVDLCASSGGP